MSQFKIFRSSDVGAPILYGVTGSLIRVLDAVLVNGYGSTAPVGWLKPISSGTSGSVYQMPSGSQMYMQVNDAAPHATALGREARITCWETASSWNTGSGMMPSGTNGLDGGGGLRYSVIRKSTTHDQTNAREWIVFVDERTLYMSVLTGDSTTYYTWMFGEIYSLAGASDYGRVALSTRVVENINTSAGDLDDMDPTNTNGAGHFLMRSFSGVAGNVGFGVHGDYAKGNTTNFAGTTPLPNGPDNAMYLSPSFVHEGTGGTIRGRLRGLWIPCHIVSSFSNGQTFSGANFFAGRSFIAVKPGAQNGVFFFETSDTLDTN